MARNDGTYKKVQGKYANPVLLIIDEWLLSIPWLQVLPQLSVFNLGNLISL